MKDFDALVLMHYDFTNDKGKQFKGTKFLVSLGTYGSVEANGPYTPDLDILSEVHLSLTYKDNKFRVKEVFN